MAESPPSGSRSDLVRCKQCLYDTYCMYRCMYVQLCLHKCMAVRALPFFPCQELEAEKTLRISVQKAEAQAVLQYQLAKAECERLKVQLDLMRQVVRDPSFVMGRVPRVGGGLTSGGVGVEPAVSTFLCVVVVVMKLLAVGRRQVLCICRHTWLQRYR